MKRSDRRAPLLHRALLRLYSGAFRREFSRSVLEALAADLAAVDVRGPAGVLRRVWLVIEFGLDGIGDRLHRFGGLFSGDGGGFWHGWGQDVRLALRSSSKRVGFTLVAVLSLAIGVGANGVVFAVVDTLMLREIPGVTAPDRMVELGLTLRGEAGGGWDYPDFVDVAESVNQLESVALYQRGPVSLADDGQGRRLLALYVTSGYFPTMGVEMARGRGFSSEIDRVPAAHEVVVLSHAAWQRDFEGDAGAIGRVVRLNRTPYTVIGIAPEAFEGNEFGIRPDLYLPMAQYPAAARDPDRFFGSRGTTWASAVARLRPSASVAETNEALEATMVRLQEAYPDNADRGAVAVRAALMPAEGRLPASIVFALLASLVLLVLAVASANVGGMMLARASARQREMAVRMALGSGRARIIRHLVTEAMVVFLFGGAAGVFIAVQGLSWLQRAPLPTFVPVSIEFALDQRIIVFGLLLTVVVGLVFGLIPALDATRGHGTAGLRVSRLSARPSRLRRGFVAGQVGVSVLLLASAAVFFRSLQAGDDVGMGFDPEGMFLTGFDLALEGYEDPEAADVFVAGLLERIRALPSVEGATVASDFPLDGGTSSSPVWPDGNTGEDSPWIRAYYARVTDEYFATLGIEMIAGREFGPQDGRTTRLVAIVNRRLADAAWPGESPLGRTVEFGLNPRLYEVVGVVDDTKSDLITDGPSAQVFTLLSQDPDPDLMLGVRQSGADVDFVSRVRREVQAYDPAMSLSGTQRLSDLAELGLLPQRLVASIAGTLGALALFLSALGVYGVIAFTVTQRTREIGVRMALGSSRRGVLGRVLLDGLRLTWPGVVIGLPLAAALATLARGLLVGVSPVDPLTHLGVALLFLVVVSAATLAPARRASAIQPATALRQE